MKYKLGIIGIGVMGEAILTCAIEKKFLSNSELAIFDIDENKLKKYTNIQKYNTANELCQNCEYILLAVKPQHFDTLSKSLIVSDNQTIISIMAGLKISSIRNKLNTNYGIARVMPNTPCRIGQGICCIAFDRTTELQEQFVKSLMSTCGSIITLPETEFDTVTSISGSGPAYVFTFIDAMIKGGEDGGLSYEDSKKLVIKTIIGTALLAESSSEPMETQIDKVCSKGGTTIEAINFYRSKDLNGIVRAGIKACKEKSEFLGKLL